MICAWILEGSAAIGLEVDGIIDRLERVMPDLPQIGVGMLIVVACASCGWIELGVNDATRQAPEAAQDVATLEMPGSVAF